MARKLKNHKLKFSLDQSAQNTDLKTSLNSIPLSFSFANNAKISNFKPVGYAPYGMFTGGMWTGVVEFFDTPLFAMCAYTVSDIRTSNGAVQIAKESINSKVNGKIAILNVQGDQNSGFSYTIHWYDNHFFKDLVCVSPQYTQNKKTATLKLAEQLDNNAN